MSVKKSLLVRFVVFACIGIVTYDACAAGLSKQLGVSYATFSIPSLLLYLCLGIIMGRVIHDVFQVGSVLVATAFSDVTLGWLAAAAIGPGRPGNATPGMIVASGVAGAVVACLFGFFGFGLAKILFRRQPFG